MLVIVHFETPYFLSTSEGTKACLLAQNIVHGTRVILDKGADATVVSLRYFRYGNFRRVQPEKQE